MNHYESLFPDNKMPSDWYGLLILPVPKLVTTFDKDGELFGLIVMSKHEDDTWIINSIAKGDARYTFAMQRTIIEFTKSHDKVIIMSTLKNSCINRFTDRFVDNGEQSCFAKGV